MTGHAFDKEKLARLSNFVRSLNPDINPKAIQLMDEMRMAAHALYQIRESSVNEAGMSYAKYRILIGLMFSEEIEGRAELNPSEISRRQGTSRNTISALIRDLEDAGLIERHLNQKDRRKFNIKLTKAGRSRVRDHIRHHTRAVGACFEALTGDEQETLSQLLSKIIANARAIQEQR